MVFTGGWGNFTASKECLQFSIVSYGQQNWDSLPSLNVARHNHSSVAIALNIFVVCGLDENLNYLKSIEVLRNFDVKHDKIIPKVNDSLAWSVLENEQLGPRERPLLALLTGKRQS